MEIKFKINKEAAAKYIKEIQYEWSEFDQALHNSGYNNAMIWLAKSIVFAMLVLICIVFGLVIGIVYLVELFVRTVVYVTTIGAAAYFALTTVLPWLGIDIVAWVTKLFC